MKLFRMLGRSIRDAFKSVIRNFSLSLASISCITITLIIVAIARAIVNNPKLLLCDEPTGNLDPDMSMEIMRVLEDINNSRGTTIIMATHDKDIVNKMKKQVITLKDGRLVSFKKKGTYNNEAD